MIECIALAIIIFSLLIIAHELGHYVVGELLGYSSKISINGLGLSTTINASCFRSIYHNIPISLGGPFFQLTASLILDVLWSIPVEITMISVAKSLVPVRVCETDGYFAYISIPSRSFRRVYIVLLFVFITFTAYRLATLTDWSYFLISFLAITVFFSIDVIVRPLRIFLVARLKGNHNGNT